jgi:hypothetical protein
MAARKHITIAALKAALKANAAIYTLAAEELGVTRQTVRQRVERSPALKTFVAEVEAAIIDTAEGNVMTQIKGGDVQTSKWLLERKARERGYATRVENEHRIADDQLEAIVASLGGDVEALTALKAALEN